MKKQELEKELELLLINLSEVNCSNKIKARSIVDLLEGLNLLDNPIVSIPKFKIIQRKSFL